MNRYAISGADKKTGADARIEVTAENEAEARQAAVSEGILITECKSLGYTPHVAANRSEAYLREIVFWLRFFGIITAFWILVIVLKMVLIR